MLFASAIPKIKIIRRKEAMSNSICSFKIENTKPADAINKNKSAPGAF